MDKAEYQSRLEEIQSCVSANDYERAADLCDKIDWGRVKSMRTLTMVADIYDKRKQYDKSYKVLRHALDKSAVGKNILARLVDNAVRRGRIEEAQKYYSDFVKLAPNDPARYLFRYQIAKAKNAPLQEQISLLEKYKEYEYTESWAYELALLYSKAGDRNKCIEACDDLILWFSEGKYVLKAMELKSRYTPLTPTQQDYYDKEQAGFDPRLLNMKYRTSELPKVSETKEKAPNTADMLDRLEEAGAEVTKDVNLESTGVLGLSDEEIDKFSVTSPIFMGGSPNLKAQLAESIQNVYAGVKEAPQVENRPLSVDGFDVQALFSETAGDLAAAAEEAEEAGKTPQEEHAEAEAAINATVGVEAKAVIEEAVGEAEDAAKEAEEAAASAFEEAAAAPETVTEAVQEKAEEAVQEAEKEAKEAAEEAVQEAAETKEAAEGTVQEAEEALAAVEDAAVTAHENTEEAVQEAAEEVAEAAEDKAEEAAAAAQEKPAIIYDEREIPDEEPMPEERITHTLSLKEIGANTVPIPVEEILLHETPEERRIRILNNANPTKMSDDQRQIFTYFARVPGMDSQILEAITDVYRSAGEHTSMRGNIAVIGAPGSGKSRLSYGLVINMCKDMGLEAAKVARISGEEMNSLDPAAVVDKMAGGFLTIENASDMNAEIVDKLNKAMEFRTDCMILILEDEKNAMRAMFKKYPSFAEKITSTISIPVLTNDELVTFARTYCAENNCEMDELGVLALYTIISNNQSDDQPFTVSQVKEIVDAAISRARRSGRKSRKGGGLKNRKSVVLYEKDFVSI